jgi:hypothetical protein
MTETYGSYSVILPPSQEELEYGVWLKAYCAALQSPALADKPMSTNLVKEFASRCANFAVEKRREMLK